MPHTVPNRPTKGAAEATEASTEERVRAARISRAMDTSSTFSMRACRPMKRRARVCERALPLAHGRRRTPRAMPLVGRAPTACRRSSSSELPDQKVSSNRSMPFSNLRIEQVLVDDDRPGPQRGGDQADHHRLHDEMGGPEHAPGSYRAVCPRPQESCAFSSFSSLRGHRTCVTAFAGLGRKIRRNLGSPQARSGRSSARRVKT